MAFTIEGPTCITIEPGGIAEATYKILAAASPVTDVTLFITGLPYGVSATFSPSSGSPPFDSTLTVTSAEDSEQDAWVLNITAWDAESSKTMPVVLSNFPVIAPPNLATVTTNASMYAAGTAITVTINGGLGGVQEWVGLWVSSNPDSTFSYLSNWQYHDGTQVPPSVGPTYPKVLTFIAPMAAGTYNMRYFAYNGVSNRLAVSANITVNPAFTPNYYASPTGAGTHSGTSSGNAMQISEFWAVAAGDVSLGLLDGTYTGANSMIVPTVSGTSGHPILIRAINDGLVKIDGENLRTPCLLSARSWFVIEGINFTRGRNTGYPTSHDNSCVYLNSNANSNIFRRCGAWDAYDDGTGNVADPTIWAVSSSSDNVFEDCFGFGKGRYVFYTIAFSADAFNNKCRRCWFRYDEAISLYSSPRAVALPDYTGNETILMENCILEWNASASNVPSGSDAAQLCLEGAGFNNADPTNCTGKLTIRGSLFFIGPSSQSYNFGNGNAIVLYGNSKHTDINYLTICIDPANSAFGKAILAIAPNATFDGQLTNVITIGTNADSINSGWSPSNVNHYSTTAACPNPYAFLTYRWIGGVMDLNEPHMWPWPMRQRIIDATTSSSWPVADVHADVEAILGTLPS